QEIQQRVAWMESGTRHPGERCQGAMFPHLRAARSNAGYGRLQISYPRYQTQSRQSIAHAKHKPIPFSRRVDARVLIFVPTPTEGWAERRQALGACEAPLGVHITRHARAEKRTAHA